ncbi:MAG: carboxypeptidase regulatory-like domain-containing protein, partial [Planctomycetes bacterium]|nr:carboxypeptidase regulatory-like domain-containing protein [Planctomycetota bacterium]
MGNRLTLPLLLLAALLAGGAFFWMTGSERDGSSAGRTVLERAPLAAEDRPVPDLAEPKVVSAAPKASSVPARVELEESREPAPTPKAGRAGTVSLRGQVVDRFGTPIAGARVLAAADTGFALDLELEREFPWMKRQRTETDAEGRFIHG